MRREALSIEQFMVLDDLIRGKAGENALSRMAGRWVERSPDAPTVLAMAETAQELLPGKQTSLPAVVDVLVGQLRMLHREREQAHRKHTDSTPFR